MNNEIPTASDVGVTLTRKEADTVVRVLQLLLFQGDQYTFGKEQEFENVIYALQADCVFIEEPDNK